MSVTDTGRRILLSSVGVSGPKLTRYTQMGVEAQSHFSAFGLWQLLPVDQKPDEIWFLLTPNARSSAWDAINSEADELGVSVHPIDLTSDADDTRDFLEQTAVQIPVGCRLMLNVTEGLRHHAFLFYAVALYLTEFRNVCIDGVWYCRLETDERDDPKPVIDLKPVLELARWFHALAVFQETGSLREISRLIRAGEPKSLVESLALFFANGMPLEAGNVASQLLDYAGHRQLLDEIPLGGELQSLLIREIEPLVGTKFKSSPKSPEESKKAIPLTHTELQRQAVFIERYIDAGQYNLGFGLLREWIVNWIALQGGRRPAGTPNASQALQADPNGNNSITWLDPKERTSIEQGLGGLGAVFRDKQGNSYKHATIRDKLSDEQREWADRWNRTCELRNVLQHHGMKTVAFHPQRADIGRAHEDFQNRTDWSRPLAFGGGFGRLLICPIGLTPGVLYSAVRRTNPDRLIVICSTESASAIDEALGKAGRELETKRLTMDNAYTGIGEFDRLLTEASVWLFEADDIRANLTGGTTLMGVLGTRLAQRAQREYQRAVYEFVLIDPRLPEQQRADPWQLGDIHYLGGEPPNSGDHVAASSDLEDEGTTIRRTSRDGQ